MRTSVALPRSRRPFVSLAAAGFFGGLVFAAWLALPTAGLASAALPRVATAQTASWANTFPNLTADAMDKSTVLLPSQLEGRRNLLVLSWARDQAREAESWMPAAQALEHIHPDARSYSILVSAPENILFRWWDNSSLRSMQTDPELLHSTLALYTDQAALRRDLGVSSEHQVTVLLVDRSGHILWKAQGPSTPAARQAMLAAANRA